MKATVFTHNENSEPTVVDTDLDTGLGEAGPGGERQPYPLSQLLHDVLGSVSVDDIYIVSENSILIALHALHGALRALDAPSVMQEEAAHEARHWLTAGLRELAFYDVDGLEVDHQGCDCNGLTSVCDHGPHEPIAADPGREAVDKIRCGTHLTTGTTFYVGWPEDNR